MSQTIVDDVELRVATSTDTARLHVLAAATFPLACPPTTTNEAKADFIAQHLSEAAFGEYLADATREIVIAERSGAAIGYAMVVAGEPTDTDVARALPERPVAELSKLYVLADHQGSGVAAALVAECVDRARASGAHVLWLGVNVHNARANRFYERQGFVRVGEKRFLVGDVYENDYVRSMNLLAGDRAPDDSAVARN